MRLAWLTEPSSHSHCSCRTCATRWRDDVGCGWFNSPWALALQPLLLVESMQPEGKDDLACGWLNPLWVFIPQPLQVLQPMWPRGRDDAQLIDGLHPAATTRADPTSLLASHFSSAQRRPTALALALLEVSPVAGREELGGGHRSPNLPNVCGTDPGEARAEGGVFSPSPAISPHRPAATL